MSLDRLLALSDHGLVEVPAAQWPEIVSFCWDEGVSTGDARYCVLSRALGTIESWWSEHDAAPTALATKIDDLLRNSLPAILATGSASDGARLADEFSRAVFPLLVPASDWERGGYLRAEADE